MFLIGKLHDGGYVRPVACIEGRRRTSKVTKARWMGATTRNPEGEINPIYKFKKSVFKKTSMCISSTTPLLAAHLLRGICYDH